MFLALIAHYYTHALPPEGVVVFVQLLDLELLDQYLFAHFQDPEVAS